MSGIVGLLHLDVSPVDVPLLRKLTASLAFRGPDAQDVWAGGAIGFGHTLLRASDESGHEHQPFSFDGLVWIVADARIDARAELVSELRAAGRRAEEASPDVELILHAYHRWGETCVEHLLGDFVFAVWDGPRRMLFCARDHFGVKPFFYSHIGNHLLFSNTLKCLRFHPGVSNRLNELAVADFLLFAENQDPSTSIFADIQRLPPAHTLSWANGSLQVKRFWSLPTDGCIRYKRDREYVEHFWSLFEAAVRDRLRTSRAVVSMSGGLDSTAVAAVAREALARRYPQYDLSARTFVIERLIPDREGHFASQVAASLGIPLEFTTLDQHEPFEGWRECVIRPVEPQLEPYNSLLFEFYGRLARTCPVLFTGHGADPMMFPPVAHLERSLSEFHLWFLAKSFVKYWSAFYRRPPLGGMRQRIRSWLRAPAENADFPPWLDPGFVARLNLTDRWREAQRHEPDVHPTSPEAYAKLTGRFWPNLFEAQDAGFTGAPLEIRQPFFDVRLVAFTLSIPPIPWFWDKMLLRQALKGALPESIRRRPKSPLAGDPVAEYLRGQATHWVDDFVPLPELSHYVVRERIPRVAGSDSSGSWWVHLRPLALNLWLQELGASSG